MMNIPKDCNKMKYFPVSYYRLLLLKQQIFKFGCFMVVGKIVVIIKFICYFKYLHATHVGCSCQRFNIKSHKCISLGEFNDGYLGKKSKIPVTLEMCFMIRVIGIYIARMLRLFLCELKYRIVKCFMIIFACCLGFYI